MTDTPERHEGYEERLAKERDTFESVQEVHDLPPIFHYWSNKHIRPMVKEYGFCLAEEFFAKYCAIAAKRTNHPPVFLSLGAGNCDTEVRTAQLLRNVGLTDFVIECLELNPQMIERGKDLAAQSGVNANIVFVQDDFNRWKPNKQYAAIFAYQSLHHVLELEHLFAEVKRGLHPAGFFVTSDMIGRNGHQRWPEAMDALKPFWNELPFEYRRNRSLKRYEEEYVNHDCSTEGFEGIRAQDILPLLLRNFDFHMFIAFGNIIDVFVDRSFGDVYKRQGLAFVSTTAPQRPVSAQEIIDSRYAFEKRLTEAKKEPLPLNLNWYPYDSLASIDHMSTFLHRYFADFERAFQSGPVIDFGCGDGDIPLFFASLGCEVAAADNPPSNHNWMAGVRALRERLNLPMQIYELNADVAAQLPGTTYGLAISLGVLYHLKNPYLALETLAKQSRYCVLSTRVADVTKSGVPIKDEPLAYLLNHRESNNDPTNQWIFSPTGLERIVKRSGWRIIDQLRVCLLYTSRCV